MIQCEVLFVQFHPTLWDPMDCSLPVSSVHGILQARTLEWLAIPVSRRSFQCGDGTQVSCIAGGFFTIWATREALWSNRYWLFDLWFLCLFQSYLSWELCFTWQMKAWDTASHITLVRLLQTGGGCRSCLIQGDEYFASFMSSVSSHHNLMAWWLQSPLFTDMAVSIFHSH